MKNPDCLSTMHSFTPEACALEGLRTYGKYIHGIDLKGYQAKSISLTEFFIFTGLAQKALARHTKQAILGLFSGEKARFI